MVWQRSSRTLPWHQWDRIRRNVLARDNHKCVMCGRYANEVDHILSKAMGGTDSIENLQSLCEPHHRSKTIKEAGAGKAAIARSRVRTDSKYKGPIRNID